MHNVERARRRYKSTSRGREKLSELICLSTMSVAAERYDKAQASRQSDDGMGLVNKLFPLTGSNVLDLGCGTGFLAHVIAERLGRDGKVTAVDPDTERLRIARRKYGAQENINFLHGSSESFPSGPYDIVFSNHVMHWIKDKESAFRNVYENLKVGGRLAFVCGENNSSIFWELLSTKVKESFHICSSDVYESIAVKCGFEVEFKSVDTIRYVFANVQEYTAWVFASVNADSDTINPHTLEEFMRRFGLKPVGMDWIKIMFILRKR